MAYITETAEWAEGIYQYEQDDVVEGGPDGIDNIQAKALAARTNYLKALLENLQNGKQTQDQTLTAIAALATAADKFIYFTGEDQAALGTVTAFARSLLAGADAAAVRALLSAVSQAELNAAIASLVNSSPSTLDTLKELADALGDDPNFATTMTNALATRVQIADLQKGTHVTAMAGGSADAITGSYTPGITALTNGMTLYVRAVSANATTTPTFTPNSGTIAAKTIVKGNGLALVAGDIAGAGHWLELQYDPTLDKWVLQNPTHGFGGTPAQFDNTTKTATTAFVQRALGNLSGGSAYGANTTLTAADMGQWKTVTSAGVTLTLPLLSTVAQGSTLSFYGNGIGLTVARQGTDSVVLGSSGALTSVAVGAFDTLTFVAFGTFWYPVGGATQLSAASVFAASLTGNGYQKLPNGLIIQWASGTNTAASGNQTITLPIAFPTANLKTFVTNLYGSAAQNGGYGLISTTLSQVTVARNNVDNTNGVTPLILAIGF